MLLNGKFNYLGLETFQGRKDPTQSYCSLALLQGTDVQKIFLSEEQIIMINGLKLHPMDSLDVTLSITLGAKTFVRLEEMKKLNQ